MRNSKVQRFAVLGSAVLLVMGSARACQAGPTVAVGKKVPAAQRASADQVDYSAWDQLLVKYVDEQGRVDYGGWKGAMDDRQALEAFLSRLSATSISQADSREVRLAFWINAYNALTVYGILREYPTTSIRNHTARLYGYNIWKDLQLVVGDNQYSLEQIEHEILRKMQEPRIHFAIVCASVGCPRLLNEAYTADRLDEQLTRNARAFFADETKLTVDRAGSALSVSPILKWFSEDFGANDAARLRTIAPWLPAGARELAESGRARISYLDYDWSLNGRPHAVPGAAR